MRHSRRGLVVCAPGGAPFLVEHARANEIPELLGAAAGPDEFTAMLGGSALDQQLTTDLIDERIIGTDTDVAAVAPTPPRRVALTRSGLELTGIDRIARITHRIVMPIVTHTRALDSLAKSVQQGHVVDRVDARLDVCV